jgi:hypothetical protein
VSHVAIAAALALEDVSAGERLAAFSLASFANREHRAWPSTRVAAARAGLSRSQYLHARDALQRRGLALVEEQGGGRGNAPVVRLVFAERGPWLDAPVNAPLFEAVLSYRAAKGSARLLLAALAALAGDERELAGVRTDELRAAAGLADSTYRRARAALLADGELELEQAGGGRSKTNVWRLPDPRAGDPAERIFSRTGVAPLAAARPLLATLSATREDSQTEATPLERANERQGELEPLAAASGNPGQDRTVRVEKGPGLSGVSALKGPGLSGVSGQNPAQSRTVSQKTPPQTPPKTPPPNVRAGREPWNLENNNPPYPPKGGTRDESIELVEEFLTDRGRRRRRPVLVSLDEVRRQFREPSENDRRCWLEVCRELKRIVGESMFALWIEPCVLAAVDADGCLLVRAPDETRSWIAQRFGRVLERAARSAGGCNLRVAGGRELQLLRGLHASASADTPQPDVVRQTSELRRQPIPHHNKEAV